MNAKFYINKKCRDAFLVGYPVTEKYFKENYIAGNDYYFELSNGYEVVALEEVRK